MKLLRLEPDSYKRFEAITLLSLGIFQYKRTKKGGVDRNICFDPSTGDEVRVAISNKEIVKISDNDQEEELYSALYPFLSSFVHPDVAKGSLEIFLVGSIDLDRQGDPVSALVLVMSVAVLFVTELSQAEFLSHREKEDLLSVANRSSFDISKLIRCNSVLLRGNIPEAIYKMFGEGVC